MASTTVQNRAGRSPGPPPLRQDGTFYRFEMVHDGGNRRTFGDQPADLLAALVPGYLGLADPVAAARARIQHAVRTQVLVQAAINVEAGEAGCTREQLEVLGGDRTRQPEVTEWSAPVPLVLIDCFYAGITETPVPEPISPAEIWWLRTRTEWDYLRSLARLGVIVLAERSDTGKPTDSIPPTEGS
ncbi:hypothetical protein AB0M86_45755 [Streptomyces sp. NPDC051639]|uniref:hypothetical protein n=1 Tax=Streptomyces sp. NPDC051639 TaxID=3155671 RepID=UPI0034486AD4